MTSRIEAVRQLFTERSNETSSYLELIQTLVSTKANRFARCAPNGQTQVFEYEIERDNVKALVASGYLQLYNLVESTMTNTVDAIHAQCNLENVAFETLNNSLKKVCFKNFKKVSITDIHAHEHPMTTAMVNLGYEKKSLFSGNIHAKVIKAKAEEYGFEIANHDNSESKSGVNLELVMTRRNDLAHGNISFKQCGGETSIDELIKIQNETTTYLTAVIDGVEEFINNKSYLADTA